VTKILDALRAFWSRISSLSWMTAPGFLAQAGHFAIGIIAVILPAAIAGVHYGEKVAWWWFALGGTVVDIAYFIHKETSVDPKVEDEGFWPEGAKDCLFNALGLLVAWGALWAAA